MSGEERQRTLDELGSDVPLVEPQAEADARRRRVVSQMQRVNVELVREDQKTRWLRWGVGGGLVAGAAAAIALSVVNPFASSLGPTGVQTAASTPSVSHAPLRTEMTKGSVTRVTQKSKRRLGLGDSLVLEEQHVLETQDDSGARVHGGRGLDIDVGPDSRVVVGAVDRENGAAKIQLQRGFVNCSVDPAGDGPKLSVVTPDATVEVKGTIFSVEVKEDGQSSRSCVRVERGWVTVDRRGKVEQVRAGQSSGCDAVDDARQDEAAAVEEAAAEKEAAQPTTKPIAQKSSVEPELPAIARQNSLFARALAAERKGDLDAAEAQLSQLLDRFPSTPLRADAEAARSRIRKRRAEKTP